MKAPWATTTVMPKKLEDVTNPCATAPETHDVLAARLARERARVAEDVYDTETHRFMSKPHLAKDGSYHHFYKKHMTILGLKKYLGDSSDTDSETSTNYHGKLFKRKVRFPCTERRLEQAKREAERQAQLPPKEKTPWPYRSASVTEVGEATRRTEALRGKKVFPDGFEGPDARYEEPKHPLPRPLERLRVSALETQGSATSLPNPWDARMAAEEAIPRREKQEQQRRCRTTVLDETFANSSSTRRIAAVSPPKRSVSSMTSLSIQQRVDELLRSETESLGRHKEIMRLVKSIPVRDPLQGNSW